MKPNKDLTRRVAVEALFYLHSLAEIIGDASTGQNSLQLRYQYLAHQGFAVLGLSGFDAARKELADIDAGTTAVAVTLTADEIESACKNIGYDMSCGRCAEVFYTGATMAQHKPDCATRNGQG